MPSNRRTHAEIIAEHCPLGSDQGARDSRIRNAWTQGYWYALQGEGYTEREADRVLEEGYERERLVIELGESFDGRRPG